MRADNNNGKNIKTVVWMHLRATEGRQKLEGSWHTKDGNSTSQSTLHGVAGTQAENFSPKWFENREGRVWDYWHG